MFPVLKSPSPSLHLSFYRQPHFTVTHLHSHLPSFSTSPPFSSLALPPTTDASHPSLLSSVGSPPSISVALHNLNHKHILIFNVVAFSTAISAAWLFFSAIPTLLALKKASESLEKLLDVTREELPDTMAAVRLSGMEISDLTMELSDLGQEITQGVRSSTQAVRVAEDRLRRLTTMGPAALVQVKVNQKTETEGPVLARGARSLREGIVQGRAILQVLFSISQVSKWAANYFAARGNKR